ncbi:splicing factor 1-like protein [Hamiltosporidium magnivora]|uniref:Branchpoint-bridging protein n=1 Tax=Hamiltosporidium magnivora TaxID=148818 RepID=A0A4Q9LKT4_9MICR|nr:splicing factor 1-like protein [Hamiltosporidium magnivora]
MKEENLPESIKKTGVETYILSLRLDIINKRLKLVKTKNEKENQKKDNISKFAIKNTRNFSPFINATDQTIQSAHNTNPYNITYTPYNLLPISNKDTQSLLQEIYSNRRNKILSLLKIHNPSYRMPTEYKDGSRYSKLVYIPSMEYPNINFVGMMLGPKGSTFKAIETFCNVKMNIKGTYKEPNEIKPSTKRNLDTKNLNKKYIQPNKNGTKLADENVYNETDPLYCIVYGDTLHSVEMGVLVLENLIESAIDIPEMENNLKVEQLKELRSEKSTEKENVSEWEKYYIWWYYYNVYNK